MSDEVPIVEVLKGKGAFPVEGCGGIHGLMTLINGDNPVRERTLDPTRLDELRSGTFDPDEIFPRDPMTETSLMIQLNET